MTEAPPAADGSRARRWREAVWAWLGPLLTPERRIDLVGGVTLIVVLLSTEDTWVMKIGIVSLAAAAVVDRRLLRRAGYWFAMLAVYVVGVQGVVLLIDNHEFLLGYWLLALAVSRLLADPNGGLATSARLLVGLAFAFATLWKVVTPEYLDGGLFHTMLLFDPRFAGIASAVSDMTFQGGLYNYQILGLVRSVGDGAVVRPVVDAPGIRAAALGMTWWTVVVEGAVAVCFLAPVRSVVGRARHVVLLVFLWTTYVLAPVMGFGWLLVAMGVAQAPLDKHRLYLPAFAAAFVVVLVRSTAPLGRIFGLLFPGLF